MKTIQRITLLAACALWWTAAPGATLTATAADYLWSDRFAAATNADVCVIGTDREILCPSGSTCTCGQIDLDGNLTIAGGATGVVGDPAGALTSSVELDGTLIVNGTLQVDCGADSQTTCEINVNSGGQFLVQGSYVRTGSVASVTTENCTQGYFDPALDTGSDGPDDCNASGEYDITLRVDFPVAVDQYNDMRLYFPPPYSGHPGTYYDIRDSAPPATLVLNGASRGQLLPHGVVGTNTCSGMNGTTVTLGTSISADFQDAMWGAWVVCDADCTAATVDESASSPTGLPSHSIYLPCGDARRVTSVNSGTSITIDSAVAGSGCTTSSACRLIAEPGFVWPRVEHYEAVRPGDLFVIDDPAVVTIPQANKGLRLTYTDAGNTAQDKNWVATVADNAILDFQHADIAYCGRADDAINDECFSVNRTVSNASGSTTFRYVEFYMTSGRSNLYTFENEPSPTVEWVTVRDTLYSDNNSSGDQHIFVLGANDSDTGADAVFTGLTCRRVGDDCIYDGPGVIGDDDWGDITIQKGAGIWIPNSTPQASSEYAQINDNAGVTGNVTISEVLVVDVEGGISTALDSAGTLVRDVVVMNTQTGIGSSQEATNAHTFSGRPAAIVNSACIRCGHSGVPISFAGKIHSSYFDGILRLNAPDMVNIASVYGTVIDLTQATTAREQYDPGTTTSGKFDSGGPVLKDVVFLTGTAGIQGIGQRSGITVNNSHITWINDTADHSAAAAGEYTRTLVGGGGTIAVLDSLFYGVGRVVDSANGLPGTYTVNNLLAMVDAGVCTPAGNCTGCCGATITQSGDLGVRSARNPYVTAGSAARSVTTSDGSAYPGARCAGPTSWEKLERMSPAVAAVAKRAGVADPALCADVDGDGVWDLHDNCTAYYNPLQGSCPP